MVIEYGIQKEKAPGDEILFSDFRPDMIIRVEDMPQRRGSIHEPGKWQVMYTATIKNASSAIVMLIDVRKPGAKKSEEKKYPPSAFVDYTDNREGEQMRVQRRVILVGYTR